MANVTVEEEWDTRGKQLMQTAAEAMALLHVTHTNGLLHDDSNPQPCFESNRTTPRDLVRTGSLDNLYRSSTWGGSLLHHDQLSRMLLRIKSQLDAALTVHGYRSKSVHCPGQHAWGPVAARSVSMQIARFRCSRPRPASDTDLLLPGKTRWMRVAVPGCGVDEQLPVQDHVAPPSSNPRLDFTDVDSVGGLATIFVEKVTEKL